MEHMPSTYKVMTCEDDKAQKKTMILYHVFSSFLKQTQSCDLSLCVNLLGTKAHESLVFLQLNIGALVDFVSKHCKNEHIAEQTQF